jgi:hypothetical protein
MSVHDWTRIDSGTYHAFHSAWNTHLMGSLNAGLLPRDYYALSEQVASRRQTDVLTLRHTRRSSGPPDPTLTVTDTMPSTRLRIRPVARPRRQVAPRRRRVVVRHITGHQIVAVIEITSPANKDRRASVREFADKIVQMIEGSIGALVIDLLPPGRYDPQGMHGAIWQSFDPAGYQPPPDEPFTLASYRWDGTEPEAFVEPVGLGAPLGDLPLFLDAERYIHVPLERTYLEAYRNLPALSREMLEGTDPLPPD